MLFCIKKRMSWGPRIFWVGQMGSQHPVSLLWFQISNHFQFQIMNVITYASFISIDEKWPKSFPYFIIIHIIQAFQMLVKNAVNHIRNVMQLLSKTEVKLFELVLSML